MDPSHGAGLPHSIPCRIPIRIAKPNYQCYPIRSIGMTADFPVKGKPVRHPWVMLTRHWTVTPAAVGCDKSDTHVAWDVRHGAIHWIINRRSVLKETLESHQKGSSNNFQPPRRLRNAHSPHLPFSIVNEEALIGFIARRFGTTTAEGAPFTNTIDNLGPKRTNDDLKSLQCGGRWRDGQGAST
ncbi:hypothetical protein VFPPC_18270 [Pochonia chlamydosporia 170]|uniref:Uncharacterized protein n=1 Tax=Pochonia chlamydosporia 170 TaxID=1380566 RepID=A0A219APX1_METCM|nr:hypothetical protein VFPPC_18270 [Pochonia chlamydosporia 170]OWT42602.1 hypothetical protein VFPPC_18270 [Pochonia chlamydosporia 170]